MMKWMRIVALTLLVPAFVACDDSTEPDDHAEDVASVRLTIGNQTITMGPSGNVTGGNVTLVRNTSTPVTAVFLAADGDVITLSNEFRLDLTPSTGITFARTGPFAGTLTSATAGSGTVQVCVFHIPAGHCDYGSSTGITHRFNVTTQ
jgi:hypothetical protein